MSDTLASLQIELGAKIDGLTAALTSVQSQLLGLSSQAAKTGKEVESGIKLASESAEHARESFKNLAESILEAVGIRFAVRGLVDFTKEALEAGNQVVELSERLGVSTDELQKLSYFATQSGTNLEAVSGSISFMNRVLGEAATGNRTAAQAFTQLHLSVQQLLAENPADRFMTVASAINSLGSDAERSKASADTMGRGYRELGNLMHLSAGQMQEAMDQAVRAGDVASPETLEKIHQLGLEYDGVKQHLQVLTQEGFVALYNVTKTDAFGSVATEARSLASALENDLGPAFTAVGAVAVKVIDTIADRLKTGMTVVETFANTVTLAAGTLAIRDEELVGAIDHDTAQDALQNLQAQILGTGKAASDAADGVDKLSGESGGGGMNRLIQYSKEAENAAKQVQQSLDDMDIAAAADISKVGDDKIFDALNEVSIAVEKVAANYYNATGQVLRFTAAQQQQIEDIKNLREEAVALGELQAAYTSTMTPLEKYAHDVNQLQEAYDTLARTDPSQLTPQYIAAFQPR